MSNASRRPKQNTSGVREAVQLFSMISLRLPNDPRISTAAMACSSKAAVTNLTQTAALELRPFNVRVNCVLPGMISTPMLEEIRSAFETLAPMPIEQMIELKQGRGGDPADIARALVYLASGDAEFVSGAALTADNAMSASLF